MRQVCKYCEGADIVDVVPGLGVDVCSAIESGIIEDKSANVFHNLMQDLGEIGNVVREPFDIIEYDRTYTKFRKYVDEEESAKKKQ